MPITGSRVDQYIANAACCDWLTEAKTEAARDKRMTPAVELIAEGKKRDWKDENC